MWILLVFHRGSFSDNFPTLFQKFSSFATYFLLCSKISLAAQIILRLHQNPTHLKQKVCVHYEITLFVTSPLPSPSKNSLQQALPCIQSFCTRCTDTLARNAPCNNFQALRKEQRLSPNRKNRQREHVFRWKTRTKLTSHSTLGLCIPHCIRAT